MKRLFISIVVFMLGCVSTPVRFGNPLTEQNIPQSKYANIIVKVVTINPIESSVVRSAKDAYFTVSEDVKDIYGNAIIRKNESVSTLISVNSRGGSGRPGKITIEFQKTKDVRGNTVYFNSDPVEIEGISRRGVSIGLTVGMFFVYFPFNFLHLIQEGDDVTIPAGYIYQVKIK
jgi:hypothetical protein